MYTDVDNPSDDCKLKDKLTHASGSVSENPAVNQLCPIAATLSNIYPVFLEEVAIENLIEAFPGPMLISTMDGTIIAANDLALEVFAYKDIELKGLIVEDLIPERFRLQHKIYRENYAQNPSARRMTAQTASIKNLYALTKDGAEFPVDISLSTMSIKETKHIIIGVKDLTIYNRDQQQLQEQSAELSKQIILTSSINQQEEIMNFFYHELRTLLQIMSSTLFVIENILKKLRKTHSLSEQQSLQCSLDEHMAILSSVNEQQIILVNLSLAFNKSQQKNLTLQLVNCELKETIQQIIKIFYIQIKNKNLELKLELPKDPIWVKLDRNLLTIIINNLISNAIKFTEQGYIALYVNLQPSINFCMEEVTINFVIKDTGIGMSMEEVSKLFKKFTQANKTIENKYGGSGLGLYIIKNLIELMGGTISVESVPSEGSSFYFSANVKLLSSQELTEIPSPKRGKQPKFLEKKVLIVEDSTINASLIFNFLTEVGCVCKIASNGKEALKLISANEFDVILMDLEMPILGGIEATQEIRKIKTTPIIGVTGHVDLTIQEIALSKGMNAIITKPYNFKELSNLLKRFLPTCPDIEEISNFPKPESEHNASCSGKGKETYLLPNTSSRNIFFTNHPQDKSDESSFGHTHGTIMPQNVTKDNPFKYNCTSCKCIIV